jgi:hypothetical protein
MSNWNPVWKVTIDGTDYTDAILSNLTIRTGRTNIYEQAQAGYCNIQLIDLDQSTIPVYINSAISIQVQDTSSTYVAIFGGTVVDIALEVRDVGSTMFTQTYSITALGALARLPKSLTDGVLSKDFDGDQILTILTDLLINSWNEVSPSETWAAYDPTITWANAENVGLGEIDTPGNYELAARTSNPVDVYSLVSALATSGLGYLYESATGAISYADSTHRSDYLNANGYVELTGNQARAAGLRTETRAGDVRNNVTIKYDATSSSEVNAFDAASIAEYGPLSQIISTTLHNSVDASAQANFYLSLRKTPYANFSEISFDLTNPEVDDSDRDALLNCFMGMPVAIADLPTNMGTTFQGFVEGWSFQASYNQLAISLNVSPVQFSLPLVYGSYSLAQTIVNAGTTTYTVPSGVSQIAVLLKAYGGDGANGTNASGNGAAGGGGGGGAGAAAFWNYDVTAGQTFAVTLDFTGTKIVSFGSLISVSSGSNGVGQAGGSSGSLNAVDAAVDFYTFETGFPGGSGGAIKTTTGNGNPGQDGFGTGTILSLPTGIGLPTNFTSGAAGAGGGGGAKGTAGSFLSGGSGGSPNGGSGGNALQDGDLNGYDGTGTVSGTGSGGGGGGGGASQTGFGNGNGGTRSTGSGAQVRIYTR